MKNKVLIAVLLFVAATVAQAQQPMPYGKWWQRPAMASKLQLTPDQQQKLDDIFKGSQDELLDARADVKKLEIDFRRELNRSELRRPVLQKAASDLSAARARMFDRELLMLVEMRTVLKDYQWVRLQVEQQPRFQRPNGPGHRQ